MELAGKYKSLAEWAETPEATGGQYPTLKQGLNKQLAVLKTAAPGSAVAMQAMIEISEIQNAIGAINAENKRNYSNPPGSDPRDYPLEFDAPGNPIFWASQALPLGVTIDEAIKQGYWRGKT